MALSSLNINARPAARTIISLVHIRGAKRPAEDSNAKKAFEEVQKLVAPAAARPLQPLTHEEIDARAFIAKEACRRAQRQQNQALKKVNASFQSALHAFATLESLGHEELLLRAMRPQTEQFPLEAKIAMETPPGSQQLEIST
eukprot:TRINITY_DN3852_c0_g1_i1.p1 TRINITY_DN3852_c0_g1~~TRINITY_DN3852_c0_g1_i1.p1  ORF type:complete len:143 (+),score=22.81 TRINITY_DN3852_c0_g1_i1:71-499(+)